MDDLTILVSVGMIAISSLITIYRLTQNPKAKQKDTHYSTLIKIKDDTIQDATKTIKSLRSKIQRMDQGGTIQNNDEVGEGLEDLIDLYDNAPSWIKTIVSKDDVRKLLKEGEKGKVQNLVDKFRNRKDNKEQSLDSNGL